MDEFKALIVIIPFCIGAFLAGWYLEGGGSMADKSINKRDKKHDQLL